MEQKPWLWRKKSPAIPNKKLAPQFASNEEEKEETVEIDRLLGDLNVQLSLAQSESKAKDELLAEQIKKAEEAVAGWLKSEAEAASFKQQFDEACRTKTASEERVICLETALRECAQKLRSVKDENGNLGEILQLKEKLVEDLNERKTISEVNFDMLSSRLETSERLNASLGYEVGMLRKELDIRNAEREFDLKSVDAVHRQHLASIKKVSKLEAECQRLRVMLQKRLPGPAALTKMRATIETPGLRDSETWNRKPNNLIRKLSSVEEENKILKEALAKKSGELRSSWAMYARTASKLSRAERQLAEFTRGHARVAALSMSSHVSHESQQHDYSEVDSVSCTESWASALISELEHFRAAGNLTPPPLSKTTGDSELSLMDDFLEMERLAILCLENQSGGNINLRNPALDSENPSSADKVSSNSPDENEPLDDEDEADTGTDTQVQKILDVGLPDVFNPKNKKSLSSLNDCLSHLNALYQMEEMDLGERPELDSTRKESKGADLHQTEKLISIVNGEDRDRLEAVENKKRELRQKLSSCFETNETGQSNTHMDEECLRVLHLESAKAPSEKSRIQKDNGGKGFRTDLEISAASEKLAQCQETIMNLGKQLNALAWPRDAALVDTVSNSAADATVRRSASPDPVRVDIDSSSDRLEPQSVGAESPRAGLLYGKRTVAKNRSTTTIASLIQMSPSSEESAGSPVGISGSSRRFVRNGGGATGVLAVVPRRRNQRFGRFIRRLLSRRKSETGKKATLALMC